MPDKCFVPGCKSGYASCSVKASMFKPPVDPSVLEQWRRAVPRADRVLCERDRICELHFASHLICRTFRVEIGGETVELPREKPQLVEGAIPHIFPNCPAYLSTRAPKKRKHRSLSQEIHPSKLSECFTEQMLVDQEQSSFTEVLTFEKLCDDPCSCCPQTWNTVCMNEDYICFGKLDIIDGQMSVVTSVSVSKMMSLKIFFKGQPAAVCNLQRVTTKRELMTVFEKIDVSHACPGNPDEHLLKAINRSRIGCLEASSTWRHMACCRLTVNDRCHPCQKLRRILQVAAKRRSKNMKLCIGRSCKVIRKRRLRRLQKSVSMCRMMAVRLKQQLKQTTTQKLNDLIKDFPENQQLVVKHCLKRLTVKSSRGMRYDHKWILNCILLRIKSPKAYSHLRDHCFLSLPSRSTLSRYIDRVRIESGVSKQMIDALSQRVKTPSERHGVLLFDEIHLRPGMRFSNKTLEFEGLVDFGEFTSVRQRKELADTGLVFMYRPIGYSWVQTVGMFLSKGPTPATVLSKLLLKLIIALESHGVWVDGVICDGSTTNRGVWKEFGLKTDTNGIANSIHHPLADLDGTHRDHDRLYFFSDYVHLFKCIRNNLLNRLIFKLPDGDVLMDHFIKLLKLDVCHDGLRVVPKLTASHVAPNNFQRMKVKLAVQLFSNSVADGLTFYKERGATELTSADATISFVRRLNKLFDVLNSKRSCSAMRLNSENMRFLESSIKWLDEWETFARSSAGDMKKFLSPSTAAGLRVTLMSTLELSRFLLQHHFTYILTSRFSQDPLEHFFGLIRHAGGCEDHPTTVMFMQLYRLLSVYSLIRLPKRRCEAGECLVIASQLPVEAGPHATKHSSTVAVVAECLDSLAVFSADEDIDPSEVPEPSHGTAKENIIYYVAGFVLRRAKRLTSCDVCVSKLSGQPQSSPEANLINIKLRGSLHWPSDVLYSCLRDVDNMLCSYINDKLQPFMFATIVDETVAAMMPLKSALCSEHGSTITAEILVYYVCTRLHWHAKTVTRDTVSKQKTKNSRKKAKLC